MSSSEARNLKPEVGSQKFFFWFLISVFCILISACGFTPLHTGKDGTVYRAGIEIANIPDREGQYLRNFLIDRLYQNGRPHDAPYLLSIAPLDKKITNMGIRKDATSTRGQLDITAVMALVEKETGKVLLERQVRAGGGYNQLDNQFASLISENRLTDHALEEIGDNILTELNLYFQRTAP